MDMLMIIIFPFLDFIPFAIPRYLLFKDKLRIHFSYILLIIIGVASLNSAIFYYLNIHQLENATTLMRYGFMIINFVLSFSLIKDRFSKLMFSYLLLVAWSFFVYGNANFIESRFFTEFSIQHPYLIYNFIRIVVYLLTLPIMYHFLFHSVQEALLIEDHKMWRYLWIIPLFSTLFGMLYCTIGDVFAFASWQFLISRYLMLFGACYTSYIVLKILKVSQERLHLKQTLAYADQLLYAQKKQYDELTSHMEEMYRARHDLRQHLTIIQSYIEKDNKKGLEEYISLYKSQLPPDIIEIYSRHPVVNALICNYATLARKHKIRFDAKIDYPETCQISDTDITVLLGNILENAIESCLKNCEDSYIHIIIKQRYNESLLLMVDNTCTQAITFNHDNIPLSTKRNCLSIGIGISSICDIALKYNGFSQFEQKNNVFYTSVFLKLPPKNN